MKKYTFLVYHKNYQVFLDELQELGVLHIIRKNKFRDPELKPFEDKITEVNQNIKFLKNRSRNAKASSKKFSLENVNDQINELLDRKAKMTADLTALVTEYDQIEKWGKVSIPLLQKLKDYGVYFDFYACNPSHFREEWTKKYAIKIISQDSSMIYFVLIRRANEDIHIGLDKQKAPHRDLEVLLNLINDYKLKLDEIEDKLDFYALEGLDSLQNYKSELVRKLEFDDHYTQSDYTAEDKVVIVKGWISEPNEPKMIEYLQAKNIFYYEAGPEENEQPPIALKNNAFAKLFEPIGKLYSLPSYMELDLTAFFAPFFMIFFGFCTGDFGYGLTILIACTIAKMKVKDDGLKGFLSLGQFLGTGTIIMGLAMGAIFGFDMKGWAGIGNLIPIKNNDMVFKFALILGVLQVLFGVIMNFANRVRNGRFIDGVSTIGTFFFILFVTILASPVMQAKPSAQLLNISKYGLYFGLFLIFFFNTPGKNIFLNFAKGLWELYNIVTGFFGDLLSYIRLFALGVSGGILGYVVNTMAMQFKAIPFVGFVIMILVMIVGHAANLALSSLGAFVHPMRLTFVEFYKNSGFIGGGKEYKPFGK
jgi:V/A-type H+-transporting ATPase subunit I